MIFTDFFFPTLYNFLFPFNGDEDTLKSTLLDQIPPFDVLVTRRNENGYGTYQMIFGVEFVAIGKVNSVHDMIIEKTVSYKAIEFTEEVPLDTGKFLNRVKSSVWNRYFARVVSPKEAGKFLSNNRSLSHERNNILF